MRTTTSKLFFNTVDNKGEVLPGRNRDIFNSAAGEYFPKELLEKACFVQWPAEVLAAKPEEAAKALESDITYTRQDKHGRQVGGAITVSGDDAWGSGIKKGITLGLPIEYQNYFIDQGWLAFEEDAYRLVTEFFSNGAGGLRGQVKARFVPEHTIITLNDGSTRVIEDGGAALARESWLKQMQADPKYLRFDPVSYSKARLSDTVLQYFDLNPELWEELLPTMDEGIEHVNQGDIFTLASQVDDDAKSSFMLDLDEDVRRAMTLHPYFAAAFEDKAADYCYRLATTGGLSMDWALLVPTTEDKLVVPERMAGSDEFVMIAYPVDQAQNIQCLEATAVGEEAARINSSWFAQYRAISDGPKNTPETSVALKGVIEFVPDHLMPEGVDFITFAGDIKLWKWYNQEPELIGERKNEWEENGGDMIIPDITFSFIQLFSPGCAIGIPYAFAKAGGRDYDGDGAGFWAADTTPEITRQVKAFGPGINPKLPKTKTPINSQAAPAGQAALGMVDDLDSFFDVSGIGDLDDIL